MTDQLPTTIVQSSAVDLALYGWLDEKGQKSVRTRNAYMDTINTFRAALQHQGLDLLSVQNVDDRRAIGMIAQQYSSWSAKGKQVTTATSNQRLAILSSFYEYALRHELAEQNPVKRVKRGKVQSYAKAQALDLDDVTLAMRTIDRAIPNGARDYALLAVLLQTGRRLSEVAALTWGNTAVKGTIITLTFEHCKGNKTMRDELPPTVSEALLKWLRLYYGHDLKPLPANTPIFVSLAKGPSRGKPLGIQAIADVCQKHFKTSKVHTMRHTWAHTMQEAGAAISEIQARLGHESLATTGSYLTQLKQAKNRHAEKLAALYGID